MASSSGCAGGFAFFFGLGAGFAAGRFFFGGCARRGLSAAASCRASAASPDVSAFLCFLGGRPRGIGRCGGGDGAGVISAVVCCWCRRRRRGRELALPAALRAELCHAAPELAPREGAPARRDRRDVLVHRFAEVAQRIDLL